MTDIIRPAVPADASECGRIFHDAFKAIADAHGFPPDVPSPEVGAALLGMLIGHSGFHKLVFERGGRLIGSNFMDERSAIFGIGPISIDPAAQNQGTGAALMRAMIDRATERAAPGVRLVQAAYHNRSLCLYTMLGFRTREPLSVLQGTPPGTRFAGYDVRPATPADADSCDALCRDVHGFDRGGDLGDAITQQTAMVVEHLGRITGYATNVAFFGHAVGRTSQDLIALIAAAPEYPGPGFFVPTRNHEVFAWCLANGLRLVMQMTLMTIGLYNEPTGAYLPSILY
jgi:predicted N-acetyltransferase YhbS